MGSKGRYGLRVKSERFRDKWLTIKRYINSSVNYYRYFTLLVENALNILYL